MTKLIFNKKAAMFGLDARIALAIFGALSIITGAALYSAIGSSKATALLAEMNEIGKAFEQYYLDTREYIPTTGTLPTQIATRDVKPLITSTKKGWQGPYLSYDKLSAYGTGFAFDHPEYQNVYILFLNDKPTWGDAIFWHSSDKGICNSTDPCYAWVMINKVPIETVKTIDKKVDGSVSPTTGTIRWSLEAASGQTDLMLKIMPVQFP